MNKNAKNIENLLMDIERLEGELEENKKALREARRDKEIEQQIIKSIHEGIWMLDLKSVTTYVSERMAAMLGYIQAEMAGRNSFEFVFPDDVPSVQSEWEQHLIDTNGWQSEYRLLHKDGRIIWCLINSSTVVGEDGRTRAILRMCSDITEHKSSDEALRLSEERFRVAVRNSSFVPSQVDRELRYSWIYNPHPDFDPSQAIGKRDDELEDSEGTRRLVALKKKVIESGIGVREEISFQRSDGIRTYDFTIEPLRDIGENIVGATCAAFDITERKCAEEALSHERELLQRIIDNIPVMLVMWDPKFSRFTLNPHAQAVLGWSTEDANQGDFMAKVYPDKDYRAEVASYMQSLEIGWREFNCAAKDGQLIPCYWANIRLADDSMIGIGLDLRERKQVEEKIRRQYVILDGINRIFQETLSSRTEEELGLLCLSIVQDITGSQFGFIGEIGQDGSLHDIAVSHSGWQFCTMYDKTGHRSPSGSFKIHGLYGRVLTDGKSLIANDPSAHPDTIGVPEGHPSLTAFLGVPLKQDGRTIGLIAVANRNGGYREEDREILEAVAPVIVESFGRKRAEAAIKKSEEALRKSRDELEEKVSQRTAELAKTNELLEKVFSSVDLAIAYMDKDFNFIRVNRVYAEADGRKPEFFAGKNHFSLYPNEKNERIFRRVVKTGKPYSVYAKPFEYPLHPERGITYWDWSLQPVKGPDGGVEAVVLSLVDVTERIRAEESVRKNEALLRTVFETLPVGVWLADKEGRIIHGNPAGQKIWGGAKYVGIDQFDEYKGWWADTGKQIEPEEWAVTRAVRKGEISLNEEIEIECFDGSHKIIHNSAVPIRDDTQEIIGAFVVNEDITERRRAEKNLRQIQKMEALGTLAGGIAHDFNNILMPITINAEMALFDVSEKSTMHEQLQQILGAAKRGKELVKQVITFSRQQEQKKINTEIGPIIRETIKFLRSSLPKNIEIREKIETEKDTIHADPTQIHQVLMNLCSNAGYSMRENGGVLEVSLANIDADPGLIARYPDLKPGSYVKLTVSDTGCGMAQDVMERIFDPFFTTKKPGEGTGMGLSVVHGIVKNHNGVITVYSELGRGSVFHVFLPQVQGEIKTEDKMAVSIPTGKERILLIEDEPVQLHSVQRMLERLGYDVVARADSADALDTFRTAPQAFDLIITDQTMPKMTGEKLSEYVLGIRPDMPIILCTGFSELIDGDRAKTMGISEFVMKPFMVKEIAEIIRRVLEREK